MSETVKVEIEIPVEAIDAMKRYTLDSLMLEGDVPHDIKRAITQAIGKHVEASPEWEKIAAMIVAEVEAQKDHVVKSIADRIVSQLSQGVNHAASQVVQQLGSKLKSVRF